MSQTKTQLVDGFNINTSVPADSLVIDSSGRVGLGTSTPDERLNVAGAVRVTSNATSFTSSDGALIDWATDTMRLVAARNGANSSKINFVTYDSGAAVDAIRIDSDGKVGIGTTSPTRTLQINSAGNHLKLTTATTGTGAGDGFDIKVNSSTSQVDLLNYENSDIAFWTNVTERARIDSSGRLLVGTSANLDSYNFQVDSSSTAVASFTRYGADAASVRLGSSRGTQASRTALNNGDVAGIVRFAAYTGSEFSNVASIEAKCNGTPSSGNTPGQLVFSMTENGNSTPTDRVFISRDGTITSNFTITTNEAVVLNNVNTGTSYFVSFRTNNVVRGSIVVTDSSVAYNTTSDYRLKENVQPLINAIDRVNQLQVHRFNFTTDPDTTVDGFIAHETQAVVPEAVHGLKDEVDEEGNPVYQGIDQSKLVPLLTAALQEALAEIESLKARVTALEP